MIRKSIAIIIFIIFALSMNVNIEKTSNDSKVISWNGITPLKEETNVGTITINKINLQEKLYLKESKQNTVEKNIMFLDESAYPDQENGTVVLAGHSGIGEIAYFKNLDKVNVLDTIVITWKERKYEYQVLQYLVQDKDGNIEFSTKENKSYLILTTCMPHENKKQLVLVAEKIKEEVLTS